MLALTRFVGQEIVIRMGDKKCALKIMEIHGDRVRIGFDFPPEIEVNRKELDDLKHKEDRYELNP